jgi:uncharacterized protein
MLHHYAFQNFQSFRDRTVVSMLLSQKAAENGWQAVSPAGQRVSKVMAVMGANGAGKTAVLKPLVFLHWFVVHSFAAAPDSAIPLVPHALHRAEPSEFELEGEDADGLQWRYELKATPTRVLREALYKKPGRTFSYVFVREWDDSLGGYEIKQQDFGLRPSEARKVRPNASLISTAAQYGVSTAKHLASWFLASNVTVEGRAHFASNHVQYAAEIFGQEPEIKTQMAQLLSTFDMGLSDVMVHEAELPQPDGSTRKHWVAFGLHETAKGAFPLRMELESSGTQSAFVLLSRLLPVLRGGGVAVLDELDSDLHPHMLEPILSLFASEHTNPHRAQLVFTCHTAEVLDLLQKGQVLLVEKVDCASQGYRADEVKGLRSDDNLRAKYLAGALGAVPVL